MPGDNCRRVKGLQTIAGCAVSFDPPPTPRPSTTSRTGRGWGANLHTGRWIGNQENQQPAEGCHCWRWSANYTETDGEEAFRTKRERRRARCPGGQGTRLNLGGGKMEGPKTITDGKHRTLKIGTESRDHFSLCAGTGTPPPYNY